MIREAAMCEFEPAVRPALPNVHAGDPSAPPAGEFLFLNGATAPAALRLNQACFAANQWAELLPYCPAVETRVRVVAPAAQHALPLPRPEDGALAGFARWSVARYPRWRGEVVMLGECVRPAEADFMGRLIEAVAGSGRAVLYLCVGSREYLWMHRRVAARLRGARVRLAHVPQPRTAREFWLHGTAQRRLGADWQVLQPLLSSEGLCLWRDSLPGLRACAVAKVASDILLDRLRCEAIMVRTRYMPLSAAMLAGSLTRGTLTVCFQHSVVTSPASFVPIPARRYVTFGATSQGLLTRLDETVCAEAARPPVCRDIVAAGTLVDSMAPAADAFRQRTVLIVDQASDWAPRHFGGGAEQWDALRAVARALARQARSVARVLVRPHPFGLGARTWRALVAEHPRRVELRGGRPLERDIGEASIVIGLFSSVLPAAAAAGVPTLFLRPPGWYFTPDLTPFAPRLFVDPQEVVARVERMLTDEPVYRSERALAQSAAAQYFSAFNAGGFDAALVERLLAPLP
jgi:hypothetical protein